jgi:hypothetical protein
MRCLVKGEELREKIMAKIIEQVGGRQKQDSFFFRYSFILAFESHDASISNTFPSEAAETKKASRQLTQNLLSITIIDFILI